jgi:hypothetical protein
MLFMKSETNFPPDTILIITIHLCNGLLPRTSPEDLNHDDAIKNNKMAKP